MEEAPTWKREAPRGRTGGPMHGSFSTRSTTRKPFASCTTGTRSVCTRSSSGERVTTNLEVEPAQLGAPLEAAVARKLERPARRWRTSRRRTVALVAAAALLLGAAGAGIGASLLKSPAEESQGLLDASATFAGTHP